MRKSVGHQEITELIVNPRYGRVEKSANNQATQEGDSTG